MELLAQGVRLPWPALPATVHGAVADLLGAPVVAAETRVGGFSPGAACAVTLADGRRAFVKAVSTAQNPNTPDLFRREVAVNAWLPAHPAVPPLLGTYDDGDWVALVFAYVDARTPALPWSDDDLDTVLRTSVAVQEAAGSVRDVAPALTDVHAHMFTGWRTLAAGPPPEGLDPWSAEHAESLAALEAEWAAAASGDALLHSDLRADNVLVRDGRAWLIDWPWACAGAPWVDGVILAPSIALQGGPPPEEVLARAYPDAPAAAVLPMVAALAGLFTRVALAPPPPGLPTLRAFQAAQGRVSREWLARLLAC